MLSFFLNNNAFLRFKVKFLNSGIEHHICSDAQGPRTVKEGWSSIRETIGKIKYLSNSYNFNFLSCSQEHINRG